MASRTRPGEGCRVVSTRKESVTVCDPVEAYENARFEDVAAAWRRDFVFDACFDDQDEDPEAQQKAVYETLGVPLLERAWLGYDCALFATGQTGAGKPTASAKNYSFMFFVSLLLVSFSLSWSCVCLFLEKSQRMQFFLILRFSFFWNVALLRYHSHLCIKGKTYSMLGSSTCGGLIPRICDGLFDAVSATRDQVRVEASYMEVYNESVRDLLMPTGRPLRVREHPSRGAWVPDLTTVAVASRDEVAALIAIGAEARATAATKANPQSSRSHAVFTLTIERHRRQAAGGNHMEEGWWSHDDDDQRTTRSRVRLVDLAGSERVATTGTDGARLREAKSINRSLATLCDVIEALAANGRPENNNDHNRSSSSLGSSLDHGVDSWSTLEQRGGRRRSSKKQRQKRMFVPYRNSTLTWLLKDSLETGKSFVTMLACVSPCDVHHDETVATLKYAERARRVKTRPTATYVDDDDDAPTVSTLDQSSPRLTPSISRGGRRSSSSTGDFPTTRGPSFASTRGAAKTWPCLTNLNPDGEFRGARIWPLGEGVTLVGSGPDANIALRGGDVLPKHALLASAREKEDEASRFVVLVGLADATIHVDGRRLETVCREQRCDAVVLAHGSRVVFAHRHAFRFEAHKDDVEVVDPTAEWHAAQREIIDDVPRLATVGVLSDTEINGTPSPTKLKMAPRRLAGHKSDPPVFSTKFRKHPSLLLSQATGQERHLDTLLKDHDDAPDVRLLPSSKSIYHLISGTDIPHTC